MSRRRQFITIRISLDAACALNNALRREIEAAGRRRQRGETVGEEEYIRRVDSCLQAVTAAFEKAVHGDWRAELAGGERRRA